MIIETQAMNRTLALALQVLSVVGILGILALQVWAIPAVAASMAAEYPEFAFAQWPLTVALIAALVAIQVALAAVVRLLGLVRAHEIFRGAGLRWTAVMIGALAAAWGIVAVTTVWQTAAGASNPGLLLLELLALLVGGAVILLLVVMRGLLADATALRVEMDEVV